MSATTKTRHAVGSVRRVPGRAPAPVPFWRLRLVAFFVGAASLGAEIAAARLLAPYFGASTIIWANTIATVLVALSVGYAVGGRLADRRADMRGLCAIVLCASVLLAIVPFVSDPFLQEAVKALGALSLGGFAGSLAAVLALVAVPVLLLGMVAPYANRLAVERLSDTGTVTGRLYAISTAGSLFGTFLAALLLIPLIGTHRTFLVFALMLAIAAAIGAASWRFLAVAGAIGALLVVPPAAIGAGVVGARVIYSTETQYQYARVLQFPSGERWLELNEGVAVHSVYRPWSYLSGGYWDNFLVLPFAASPTVPRRIAILGDAAGTLARAYGHYFPQHARGRGRDRRRAGRDREALLRPGRAGSAPLHRRRAAVARDEQGPLRRDLRRRLPPAVHPVLPGHARVLRADPGAPEPGRGRGRQRRAPAGFGRAREGRHGDAARRVPVRRARPRRRHEHARGREHASRAAMGHGRGNPDLPPGLRPLADEVAGQLWPPLRGGTVYTDDKAPVEWLTDLSILQYAIGKR